MIELAKAARISASRDSLVILTEAAQLRELDLERADRQYLAEQLKADPSLGVLDISGRLVIAHLATESDAAKRLESARRAGDAMAARLNAAKRSEAQLISLQDDSGLSMALAEGVALGNYAFRKYKTDEKGAPSLEKLFLVAKEVSTDQVDELEDLCEAVCTARDLVNEPVSFLNAKQLAAEIRTLSRNAGF